MVQGRQGVRSTKPKARPTLAPAPPPTPDPEAGKRSNELHIRVEHISKLYTDDTGRFPIRSRSGKQYIMIAYHCDSGAILACPFKSRRDRHRLEAYDSIMERIKSKGFDVDLQILDNEASAEYKKLITDKWNATFQLVPPNMHRRNAAERAIRTFKAHFLAILAGVAADYPRYLWDLLIPQAEMTLNFLRQATLNEKISAWEFFNGAFDYDATPLGPLGSRLIAHNKPGTRNSWDFRGVDGWSIGVSLEHYRCQRYVAKSTHEERVTDTCAFRHPTLEQPQPTAADRLQHGMLKLTDALNDSAPIAPDTQLEALERLRDAFRRWSAQRGTVGPWSTCPPPSPPRQHRAAQRHPAPPPRVERNVPPKEPTPAPRVPPSLPPAKDEDDEPIARRTRSHQQTHAPVPPPAAPAPPPRVPSEPVARRTRSRTKRTSLKASLVSTFGLLAAAAAGVSTAAALAPRRPARPAPAAAAPAASAPPARVQPSKAAARMYPAAVLLQMAFPVIDQDTGDSLEYRQLKHHPKLSATWLQSYSNEMGRLCQGVGKGEQGPNKQRVKGTDTFRVTKYEDIPHDRRRDIAHVRVVCEVRPQKEDPNRTRITVAGGNINQADDQQRALPTWRQVRLLRRGQLLPPDARDGTQGVRPHKICRHPPRVPHRVQPRRIRPRQVGVLRGRPRRLRTSSVRQARQRPPAQAPQRRRLP
ncbi:hypothetical protein ACHAWF_017143 [Thalassiosira exigua]